MKYLLLIVLSISFLGLNSQELEYKRSSIYSVLIKHPEKEFNKEIDSVFKRIPLSQKFNNHNLKIRAINSNVAQGKMSDEEITIKTIEGFLSKNDIAKRLVSKWFNRNSGKNGDGTFNMNLVFERGYYNADSYDIEISKLLKRGNHILKDAGEELIGNTYVVFHDITYYDKEEGASLATVGIIIGGTIASEFVGGQVGSIISDGVDIASTISDKITGFKVRIKSYLYRLEWDENIANKFYSEYYISSPDIDKKKAYDNDKDLFKLTYIGCYESISNKIGIEGVHNKNDMIRKVCERAIDKNIALLQTEYEEFRIKTPLYSTEPITAKIGFKEDVDPNKKYEVLEVIENEDNTTEYKRVGVIKPVKDKIWDNRYMAEYEEDNPNTKFESTEFEIVSGSGFYPGMLIREI